MASDGGHQHECRLCGLAMRSADDVVLLRGELFHVGCAEPAFASSPAWRHATFGDLDMLALGKGRGALG